MRRPLLITLVPLVVIVAGLAWWYSPRQRTHRAIDRIAAPEPEVRAEGWRRLVGVGRGSSVPRAAGYRAEIASALTGAGDDALLDGVDALDGIDLWSWQHEAGLIRREVVLRTRSALEGDQRVAAERMMTLPLDAPAEVALPLFDGLLSSPSPDVRASALAGALAWAGPDRVADLAALRSSPDPSVGVTLDLAREWPPPPGADDPPPDPAEMLRAVATDRTLPAWQRRLAAWHGAVLGRAELMALLAVDPAEPDGSVYATAVLAERELTPDDATDLAEEWMVDLNDDRKRAGALLAALLGVHGDRLLALLETEDVARVRTTQRLALMAIGTPVGTEPAEEFADRALHRPDGDFDPDVALCLLRAGRADALRLIVSRPVADPSKYRGSIQQRAWLAERFIPDWHAGRPITDSVAATHIHFDRLRPRWMVMSRRMTFDDRRGVFEER